MTFTAPVLSYTLLSPMLILLGGALIGVLVEAFVSKALRPAVQLTLTLGTLLLSLVQVWRIRGQQSLTAAVGSIVIDGPAVLLQASILIIAIISVFLISDTEHFAALPAALPGSEEERQAVQSGNQITEVYPLTLFAVSGMLMFPVANDLITLFVSFAANFSQEMGTLTNETLQDYQNFQTAGAVIKKQVVEDFGGFKSSIKLTFVYEFLLRLTYNSVSIKAIPKLGYKHTNMREGSIFWNYKYGENKMLEDEVKFWVQTAKKEFFFVDDRGIKYQSENG
jgi:hypothetical protein